MSGKITECPICMERFNKTNKQPKILNCGHTFCKNCLIEQKNKSQNLICSICRENEIINDPEKIATNRAIYDLLYDPLQTLQIDQENYLGDENKKHIDFTIIMLGPPSSGKTSLVRRYIDKLFSEKYEVTVGLDFKYKKFNYKDYIIRLQIFDTAGTETFQSIAANYYKRSFGALIVFDLSDKEYFESLDSWINNYKENRDDRKDELIYLIGNKCDLDKREIQKEDIVDLMRKHNLKKYYEVSAKTGKNVDTVFVDIAKDLIKLYLDNNRYSNFTKNIVLKKNDVDNNECCCNN